MLGLLFLHRPVRALLCFLIAQPFLVVETIRMCPDAPGCRSDRRPYSGSFEAASIGRALLMTEPRGLCGLLCRWWLLCWRFAARRSLSHGPEGEAPCFGSDPWWLCQPCGTVLSAFMAGGFGLKEQGCRKERWPFIPPGCRSRKKPRKIFLKKILSK